MRRSAAGRGPGALLQMATAGGAVTERDGLVGELLVVLVQVDEVFVGRAAVLDEHVIRRQLVTHVILPEMDFRAGSPSESARARMSIARGDR